MRERGCSFQEAVKIGAEMIQFSAQSTPIQYRSPAVKDIEPIFEIARRKEEAVIGYANRLWKQGQAISGSIAERYLKVHRELEFQHWPEALRFLPSCWHSMEQRTYPVLLVKASLNGEIQAVQRIYLDAVTGEKADIAVNKLTLGRMRYGASVVLQKGESQTAYVCEGTETALSVAMAVPKDTVIASLSLGNLKNVVLPNPIQSVVLCADNDKGMQATVEQLTQVIESYQQKVAHVHLAIPPMIKTDFNDWHRAQGIIAVRKVLEKAHTMTAHANNRHSVKNHRGVALTQRTRQILQPAIAERSTVEQTKEVLQPMSAIRDMEKQRRNRQRTVQRTPQRVITPPEKSLD